ncbi:PREDICTED: dual oxidase-like isoform X2 [Priapulus caudatus]|uniref:NAD(P)H oxidase (H2O2-forming) n=1 Tax=Priapulus caudatus TaxID=37621 RepID=A0ABM1EBT6_PRICU|nr:PREDICTED: dual oxidase-like isoform X2 [Priapulus caudatus]
MDAKISRRLFPIVTAACFLLLTGTARCEDEWQRYDGWYNNRAHPPWGSLSSPLIRKAEPQFADGVYKMVMENRPNPRIISQVVMSGDDGMPSYLNRTAFLAFFGQYVSFESLMTSTMHMASCPIEIKEIPPMKCKHEAEPHCKDDTGTPFLRAPYAHMSGQAPNRPREMVNKVTGWIDGSVIYSVSEAWVSVLRGFSDGKLAHENTNRGPLPLYNTERIPLANPPTPHMHKVMPLERMFAMGDSRLNQHPATLVFGLLFFRWHNYLAERIKRQHPSWTDNDIFNRARRFNIATLQKIIIYDYLPSFINEELLPYKGYDPDIHPGTTHVFEAAAFRYGHTQIPPGMYIAYYEGNRCHFRKTDKGYPAERLCNTWWEAQKYVQKYGIDEIILGMTSQIAEREDATVISDLRENLFGPLEYSPQDLGALNIMRGRDNGIPDYNTVREMFDLDRVVAWNQINPTMYHRDGSDVNTKVKQIAELYDNDINNLDLFPVGMLESTPYGPGPTFKAIIKDHFKRLRDSDRFWFENTENELFTAEEIAEIKSFTLYDIITKVTNITTSQIQKDVFFLADDAPCRQEHQLKSSWLNPCSDRSRYDFFSGSEMTYIITFICAGLIPVVCIAIGFITVRIRQYKRNRAETKGQGELKSGLRSVAAAPWPLDMVKVDKGILAYERVQENELRKVQIKLGPDVPKIRVLGRTAQVLREFDVKVMRQVVLEISDDIRNPPIILIANPCEYDLLEAMMKKNRVPLIKISLNSKKIYYAAKTKAQRQKHLNRFFKSVFDQAFCLVQGRVVKGTSAREVIMTELTKAEFAEALGLKPESSFMDHMFNVVDKDHNGLISFREFLDMILLFSKGTLDDKTRIMFDMYDIDNSGYLDREEFSMMLRSLAEISRAEIKAEEIDKLLLSIFASCGFQDKEELTYEDFNYLLQNYRDELLGTGTDSERVAAIGRTLSTASDSSSAIREDLTPRSWMTMKLSQLSEYMEDHHLQIFYLVIFYLIVIGLFIERAAHYAYENEHNGLRKVMGFGISITSGAGAVMSFSFAMILLTSCRNTIERLKQTVLEKYVPFESAIDFHRTCAWTALAFTVIHCIGHAINFYAVSTQPIHYLKCIFSELHFESEAMPKFDYWFYKTVPGITGVLLYIIMCIMYTYASRTARRHLFNSFWVTHHLYIVLYALIIIHSSARLTQEPRFFYFFVGPAILFVFDKLTNVRRQMMEIPLLKAEVLPSDVTHLIFHRPRNFDYHSGQWVRIACSSYAPSEYHPFTLTSAPYEDTLSVHVRAVGPWTWKLREVFDPTNIGRGPYPTLYIDGPYGEGTQDWDKYEVTILIGGGNGVIPFVSVLKDLAERTSQNIGVACKKVYFIWIAQSHRQFEWLIDMLREIEDVDKQNIIKLRIFITEFVQNFDIRTSMLYICEKHFQRFSSRSMFTGLRGFTHFGRPNFSALFSSIQRTHLMVPKVGVFSCGPSSLNNSVAKTCDTLNRMGRIPYLIHQYEKLG